MAGGLGQCSSLLQRWRHRQRLRPNEDSSSTLPCRVLRTISCTRWPLVASLNLKAGYIISTIIASAWRAFHGMGHIAFLRGTVPR
ncbi:hypothetical protein FKP32DRAFT_29501 [Trametes sanguinea]|nr:hypothetical protein FKP32DRAFT_29501 [Trametes sanguinea]